MQIVGNGDTTYILLNGIEVPGNISLDKNIEILPADTSHLDLTTALETCSHPDDIAVVAGFIPLITAQLKISAPSPKELAVIAWNSTWDAILLSAVFHNEIGFNLQSDTEASAISSDSVLKATNYHMRGLSKKSAYSLNSQDIEWVNHNFSNARKLLDNDRFQTAVHCLATYRWHSMPRVQMAVLWAGIEGMFGASSEIRFRISLYIARFLHANDKATCQTVFDAIKKLYNSRSSAVHGSKVKGDLDKAVDDSANILKQLILKCVEQNGLPNENDLVP